jgi:solute carrier family 40 (iron-regulated transporter), member 1
MVASYLCWLSWPANPDETTQAQRTPFSDLSKGMLFGGIMFLDVIHDLSAIGYRLCLERDWVPVLVGPITAEMDYGLTQVNAVMMRIELTCKLVAPSLLPLIVGSFESQIGWIFLVAASTILFWASGVWCVQVIARGNVQLQLPKQVFTSLNGARNFSVDDTLTFPTLPPRSWPRRVYGVLYRDPVTRLKHYFSLPMWPASISIALLQLTALAYSATLITYLLEIGFSLSAITIARASGSILGLSGTIITPIAVTYLKKRYTQKLQPRGERNEEDDKAAEGAVTRTVGFWGVASQFICLVSISPWSSYNKLTMADPGSYLTLECLH